MQRYTILLDIKWLIDNSLIESICDSFLVTLVYIVRTVSLNTVGLENLYHLTYRRTELRVDMEDFSAVGKSGFAEYASFEVDSEAYGYMLHVDRFQDGGAGMFLSPQ